MIEFYKKQKNKMVSIFLMCVILMVAFGVVFLKKDVKQIKDENNFSVYSPQKYNQPLVVNNFNNFFSIKPVNARSSKRINQQKNIIKYRDAYHNTDVVQIKQNNKLKEDIILKQVGHPKKFEYEINANDYDYEFNDQGDLIFYQKGDEGDKELRQVFTIPEPYMYQEDQGDNGNRGKVEMRIEKNRLILEPDIEWIKNHNYPIIVDPTVEINVLNIHSRPFVGDDWTVEFTTQGKADLKIIPADQDTIDDDEFVGLYCGQQKKEPQVLEKDVIYYPNWQCDKIAKVVHYTHKAGKHHLLFEFGDEAQGIEAVKSEAFNDGESWLEGWGYRKSHTISGSNGAGTNYQVKLNVFYSSGSDSSGDVYLDSKCDTGFDDIRFTDNDGETELDYWMESKIDSNNAVFWIEVADNLDSQATIYIYYGKTGESTNSNGENTFLFFDDFSGSSLDTDKWTNYGIDNLSVSDGLLSANTTSDDPAKVVADENGSGQTGNNLAMRARFRLNTGSHNDQRAGLSLKTNLSDGRGYNYVLHDFSAGGGLDKVQFLDDYVVWGTAYSFNWSKGTWYIEEIYHNGSAVKGRINDDSWDSWTRSGRSGYFALNTGGYQENVTNDWDWALIRKIIDSEPAHSIWGEEESAPVVEAESGNKAELRSGTIKVKGGVMKVR